MPTVAQPLVLLHRRRPRTSPRLFAVALLPGAASEADAVPAITAADAQSRLVALGLLPEDAATGTWNPSTADAVRRYQAACGIEPSGVAGSATARRLLAA